MQIISRKEAFDLGRKRFFTGRECAHGHLSERFVSTGGCVRCNAERSKLFASDAKKVAMGMASGWFTYPLHPDDHAKITAMCQALDMQRGRVPYVKGQNRGQLVPASAEERARICTMRDEALGLNKPDTAFENLSDEEMSR